MAEKLILAVGCPLVVAFINLFLPLLVKLSVHLKALVVPVYKAHARMLSHGILSLSPCFSKKKRGYCDTLSICPSVESL